MAYPSKVLPSPSMLSTLCSDIEDRVLVVIHLNGANDGLNTLVPLAQYDAYANARPTLKINQSTLTSLDDTLDDNKKMGLHPSFTSFLDLYQNEELAIIQGVGYPLANRSHFKSQDLMFRGGDGTPENFDLEDGWFARYFDYRYPNYSGVPFQGMPDPLGLLMGSHINTGFHSQEAHELYLRVGGANISNYYNQLSNINDLPLETGSNTDQGEALQHIINVEQNTSLYADRILACYNAGSNNDTTYPGDQLGSQLKTVARLLSGGLQTKVFQCNKGGFDTHASQAWASNPVAGKHATLLGHMSKSIKAFQNDLKAQGLDHKVLTVVFSEFGRKVIENANYGTDHGTLNHMFVIGSAVKAGVYGQNIDLSNPG